MSLQLTSIAFAPDGAAILRTMITIDAEKLKPVALNGGTSMLRDDRAYEGLTHKQWHYVEARLTGLSVADAYRSIYEPGDVTPEAIYRQAAQVESNAKVQQRLRKRLLEVAGASSLIPIDEGFVLNGIAQLAVTGSKESTRLRGYELLGKALGLFDRKPEAEAELKTVTDVDAELRKRLSAALSPPVIDGEVAPLGPDAPTHTDRRRKPKAEPTGG